MRRLLFALSLLLTAATVRAADQPRPATADEVALFKAAMKNSSQDTEHWAYTESSVAKTSKGRERGETIMRFDPSKPYAEQFTPLQVEGKPPTERQLKAARERGEKRGERVSRAAQAAKDPTYVPPPAQLRIGGNSVTPDLDHPLVIRGEEGRVTFEVPVSSPQKDIPMDKFQVLVTVARSAVQIENVSFTIRESFRVKLIAKIKAGEASMDFTVVDPKYPPVLTSLTGDFDASILFIPVSGTFTRTRTEWKRVKSYDERLQVKIGPLQLMDF
ncbi:MAG: hypothetical protein PSW75_01430 [bacterium]|nr:hypothetical protein [bacterium]MDI1337354.1 hypothetical protein [Lacunisphaera sp.]